MPQLPSFGFGQLSLPLPTARFLADVDEILLVRICAGGRRRQLCGRLRPWQCRIDQGPADVKCDGNVVEGGSEPGFVLYSDGGLVGLHKSGNCATGEVGGGVLLTPLQALQSDNALEQKVADDRQYARNEDRDQRPQL